MKTSRTLRRTRFYWVETSLLKIVTRDKFSSYTRGGEPTYYCTTGRMKCALPLTGRKINWIYPKIISLSNYDEEPLLLTSCLSTGTCLSWNFFLTRCCNILMRAISNIHAGRRSSTPAVYNPGLGHKWLFKNVAAQFLPQSQVRWQWCAMMRTNVLIQFILVQGFSVSFPCKLTRVLL